LIDSMQVRKALRIEWKANDELRDFPHERMEELLINRYSRSDWNSRY
jgi:hypothetical protein